MDVQRIQSSDIQVCAQIYRDAYAVSPWFEQHEIPDIQVYIERFISGESRYGWVLRESGNIIGLVLCNRIPSIGKDFFRIEDICINATRQHMGYGSSFIELLVQEMKQLNADCVMLNTEKEYPSYQFYIKNGFEEVLHSSLLYRAIKLTE